MIEHILVAVSEEEPNANQIADHVAEIASGVGAEVTLFRAFTEQEFSDRLDELGYESSEPVELARRHSVVNEIAEILRASNVKLTVAAEVGPAAESVVDFVEQHEMDHVFVGGRRRSPTGKALLGSVSQQVILQLDVPCTLILND